MEALVYILLIGTLIVIFFAVFSEKHLEFLKIKPFIWFYFFNLMFFERITQIFRGSKSCIDRICGNS
jgi:hypothetical protein